MLNISVKVGLFVFKIVRVNSKFSIKSILTSVSMVFVFSGTQVTQIVCVEISAQAIVTDENCDSGSKPQEQTVSCNSKACPPEWSIEEWSECSTSCNTGQQTRSVECKQRISPDLEVRVPVAECTGEKPHEVQACNEDLPCVRWKIGEWSEVRCQRDDVKLLIY